MKRLIIKPLNSNYIVINERVTSLENFYQCAYAYANGGGYNPEDIQKQIDSQRNLFVGNKLHEVLQAFSLSETAGISTYTMVKKQIHNIFNIKDAEFYCTMIANAQIFMQQYYNKGFYKTISNEFHLYLEIECGDVLLILTGSMDAVSEVDNMFRFMDYKSSNAEWNNADLEGKIQKDLYTWLLANTVGRNKVLSFDYLIFTKHKRGTRHQRIPFYLKDTNTEITAQTYDYKDIMITTREDIETSINSLILDFCNSKVSTKYQTKSTINIDIQGVPRILDNKKCIWCSLHKEGKCPAFNKTAQNLSDIF